MTEIGVYRGDFAAFVLQRCPSLSTYYMIDPWRHLNDWNKPVNHDDSVLGAYLEETKAKTNFAADKRIILRKRPRKSSIRLQTVNWIWPTLMATTR
jgi:hypothetical protein